MKSSRRSQRSSWWSQRKVLPIAVALLACLLLAASKGMQDKDAAAAAAADKSSRKQGPSDRRTKFPNVTTASPATTTTSDLSFPSEEPPSSEIDPSDSPSSLSVADASIKKHRLIHGSRNAVTITKKEYLKKDWCKTEPFQQVVESDGCIQKRVTNRFCYGQCNSFFIPKTDKEDADASSFRSCAYCTPKVAEWVTIVLRCPSKTPPFKRKRVQIVKQCKCMAVKLD